MATAILLSERFNQANRRHAVGCQTPPHQEKSHLMYCIVDSLILPKLNT